MHYSIISANCSTVRLRVNPFLSGKCACGPDFSQVVRDAAHNLSWGLDRRFGRLCLLQKDLNKINCVSLKNAARKNEFVYLSLKVSW